MNLLRKKKDIEGSITAGHIKPVKRGAFITISGGSVDGHKKFINNRGTHEQQRHNNSR